MNSKARQALLATPFLRDAAMYWRLFKRRERTIPDTGRPDSYLREKGWPRSFASGLAQDRDGSPIPWFTYPAIDFLTARIKPAFEVFEYGCGQSTLWWENMGCRVVACENSQEWADFVRKKVGQGVSILYRELENGEYVGELGNYQNRFDVVLIDGRRRNECAAHAPRSLKSSGIIIWDNSERLRYRTGFEILESQGFRRLDFDGLGPVNPYGSRTSIFYRSENCLEI